MRIQVRVNGLEVREQKLNKELMAGTWKRSPVQIPLFQARFSLVKPTEEIATKITEQDG